MEQVLLDVLDTKSKSTLKSVEVVYNREVDDCMKAIEADRRKELAELTKNTMDKPEIEQFVPYCFLTIVKVLLLYLSK